MDMGVSTNVAIAAIVTHYRQFAGGCSSSTSPHLEGGTMTGGPRTGSVGCVPPGPGWAKWDLPTVTTDREESLRTPAGRLDLGLFACLRSHRRWCRAVDETSMTAPQSGSSRQTRGALIAPRPHRQCDIHSLAPGYEAKRLAEVCHPHGSRSISSHLKSRIGITAGVKMALLHEVLSKEQFADAATLAAAIKALPITVHATVLSTKPQHRRP